MADGGYAFLSSLAPLLSAGSELVVRINRQNLPLESELCQLVHLSAWLHTVSSPGELPVWLSTPSGRFALRRPACPLPSEAAERARQWAIKNNHKQGRTPSARTKLASGFLLLLTNLPGTDWPPERMCWLYRLRWQVELATKRLKSLIHLDHIRAQDPRLVQTYLPGKLLAALILDELSHQVYRQQPEWFLCPERPLSVWGLTHLLWEGFCQWVYNPFAGSVFHPPASAAQLLDRPAQSPSAAVSLEAGVSRVPGRGSVSLQLSKCDLLLLKLAPNEV